MIKKNEEPLDLTQYDDSEIQHMGVSFLKDLIYVLDKHASFYKSHYYYKNLSEIHNFAKKQLEWEESRVA